MMTEYKRYTFDYLLKNIWEIVKVICGFLNRIGGRIYIGITDRERVVQGISLDKV